MIGHQCQFGRAIYYLTFSVVCFYFSAVALFQHHSDFPLFAWRADQSACPHTCRDRLYDWSKHTRAIKNEFKHTQNDHLFSLQIWLKGDYVICNNVGAVFFKVWKVKKAFKIQVFWKGGKPTFLVCVHVSLSVIFFFFFSCYQPGIYVFVGIDWAFGRWLHNYTHEIEHACFKMLCSTQCCIKVFSNSLAALGFFYFFLSLEQKFSRLFGALWKFGHWLLFH